MKLFAKSPDGGRSSGVTGYFLIECKWLFTIVLLHFSEGTRESYHSHAFNAWTVWLKGRVTEFVLDRNHKPWASIHFHQWYAGDMKSTPRELVHKIYGCKGGAWCLSFRGPWSKTWAEWDQERGYTTLTHGRQEIT